MKLLSESLRRRKFIIWPGERKATRWQEGSGGCGAGRAGSALRSRARSQPHCRPRREAPPSPPPRRARARSAARLQGASHRTAPRRAAALPPRAETSPGRGPQVVRQRGLARRGARPAGRTRSEARGPAEQLQWWCSASSGTGDAEPRVTGRGRGSLGVRYRCGFGCVYRPDTDRPSPSTRNAGRGAAARAALTSGAAPACPQHSSTPQRMVWPWS